MKNRKTYAKTSWAVADIKSIKESWDIKKCAEFLEYAENQIHDDMVVRGWESIDVLLELFKDDERKN